MLARAISKQLEGPRVWVTLPQASLLGLGGPDSGPTARVATPPGVSCALLLDGNAQVLHLLAALQAHQVHTSR
jgi:hypothetical protein